MGVHVLAVDGLGRRGDPRAVIASTEGVARRLDRVSAGELASRHHGQRLYQVIGGIVVAGTCGAEPAKRQ